LEVFHAISLRWFLEPCARSFVVNLYLARVEWSSVALTDIWQVKCTDCSFESDYLFPYVTPSFPVIEVSGPEAVIYEEFLS